MSNLLHFIFNQIIEIKKPNQPLVVGINGVDTSGKTELTKKLSDYLQANGKKVQTVHTDDFHNPKKIRYDGPDEAKNYYLKSFDYTKITTEILEPIKQNNCLQKTITHLNLQTDEFDLIKTYDIDQDTFVLFEGVFLFRPELVKFLDYKIFVHIPFEMMKQRAAIRDLPTQGQEVMRKYEQKYIPAQQKYIAEISPHLIADLVTDNTDWQNPIVVKDPTSLVF